MGNQKKSLVMLVVFLVLVGGYFTFQLATKGASGSKGGSVELLEVAAADFDDEVHEFIGIVVVDFYTDTCPPCKLLAPIMSKLNGEFQGNTFVKFAKVNVGEPDNFPLARQFSIAYVPTILFFLNGELKASMNGFHKSETEKNIRGKVEELLAEIAEG